jgi:uncharacterized protein (TIGR02246 family)
VSGAKSQLFFFSHQHAVRSLNMTRHQITAAAVAAFLFAPPCFAQSVTPEGIAEQFAQAWNAHDKAAFDKIFTDDAHFIPTYDVAIEGRENVVSGIYDAHESWARDTTLTTSKISVQQLPGDAAVVHFNVSVNPPAGADAPALERTLLLVVAKQQDGWKIAAGQLTKPNCPGE